MEFKKSGLASTKTCFIDAIYKHFQIQRKLSTKGDDISKISEHEALDKSKR